MTEEHSLYQAVYSFEAENESELTLHEGDVIHVYHKDGEWWEGAVANGQIGLFPANRVVEYYLQEGEDEFGTGAGAGAGATTVNDTSYNTNSYAGASVQDVDIKYEGDAKHFADGPSRGMATSSGTTAAMNGGSGGDTSGAGAAASKATLFDLPVKEKPPTKFGPLSSNMALVSGFTVMFLGAAAMDWGVKLTEKYGEGYIFIGVYALLYGAGTLAYEHFKGGKRVGSKFPWRAIIYGVTSIPLYFSWPTFFGAAMYLVVVAVNVVAAYKGEEYDAPMRDRKMKEEREKAMPQHGQQNYCERFWEWVLIKKEQNEIGTVVFLSIYILSNFAVFFNALIEWIGINNDFAPGVRLSGWAPLAKAFGNFLDWNCALIVVPVLRTMIRGLYNASTGSETCFAKSLRALLAFVPLDQAIEFHKLVAGAVAFGSYGHTVMHLANYVNAPRPTLDRFGLWPWASGGLIIVCMMFIYGAARSNVKHGHFELFWYSHHCFVGFFVFILLHGEGGFNPNFWKWFVLPGSLYIIERALRVYRAHKPAVLVSFIHMKPNVISVEFAKEGVFADPYKEGQYIFLKCPTISRIQWHPFTISSAPQEKTVTVHIRIQSAGSWTYELARYLSAMGPLGATYFELSRQTQAGVRAGKTTGPDGNPIFQIDGPHSAPTQHVSEYHTAMIVGAGIGVTPVSSTLKSVVLHRWKYYLGHCFPDHAYFFWVARHKDIESFRWLIHVIKEAEDELYDMRAKNPRDMSLKRFEFHIYVSSVPKDQKPVHAVVDDEVGFWGVPPEDRNIDKVRAPFTELDLYQTLKCPPEHTTLGDIHIYRGRPNWNERFQAIVTSHPKGEIGVAFCGNQFIATDLREMCHTYSSVEQERIFKLHKENF